MVARPWGGLEPQGLLVGIEERGKEKLFLALEVAVERALGDLGNRGHRVHARAFDAPALADAVGRCENAFAFPRGVHGTVRHGTSLVER